jgi:hypothetical protein
MVKEIIVMLLELKKKAVDAEEAYMETLDRVIEWENIIACSDNLDKFLHQDLDEESEKFINKLIGVIENLHQCVIESKINRDKYLLEYACQKLGGKLSDVINYIDIRGKDRAIVFEDTQMMGGNITVMGTRFLQSGKIGILKSYVCLNSSQWSLK